MKQEDIHEVDRRMQQALDRCAKCSDSTNCIKYQDILFIEAHKDEAKKAVSDAVEALAGMMALLVAKSPVLLLADQGLLASFATAVFIKGYTRGRKFPTVPEVFIRECPDDPDISS